MGVGIVGMVVWVVQTCAADYILKRLCFFPRKLD